MFQISQEWLDPVSSSHQLLMSIEILRSLVPKISEAHDEISKVEPLEDQSKLLVAKATSLDLVHDRLVRGHHSGLTAAYQFTEDERFLELRDTLLPDGLQATQRSYLEQAGHAAMLRKNFTEAQRDRLASIQIGESTMLDYTDRWFDVSEQLGDVEQQKALLNHREPGERGQTHRARLQWMRIVGGLRTMADLVDLDEDQDTLIFGALRQAEDAADRRAATLRAREETDEGGAVAEATDEAEATSSQSGPAGA